jgi:DNA-binding NarL/FixJ family response regulator
MDARQRILIAKHSSAGLPAILKKLDPQRVEVVAYCDTLPLIRHDHDDVGIDICLIDLRMLRRVLRKHPADMTRINRSGVTVLILHGKHLPKARQFSQDIDGLVIADQPLNFINDSFLLAQHHHSVVPIGILASVTGDDARTASVDTLSENERAVLVHLGNAQTNQGIAKLMEIPEAAAKGLVRIVLAKLNLMNRTEAAIFAARLNRTSQAWLRTGCSMEAVPGMEAMPARASRQG